MLKIGFKDRIYNIIWTIFLLYLFLSVLAKGPGNQISKDMDKDGMLLVINTALTTFLLIIIVVWRCISFIRIKIFNSMIGDANIYEEPKTRYEIAKNKANDWIEVNKFKLNPNIPASERQKILSEIDMDNHRVKDFIKYLHINFAIPSPNGNMHLVITFLILVFFLILGYINLIEFIVIEFLHQFLASEINRRVIYYSLYFTLRYMALFLATKGFLGNKAKIISAKILVKYEEEQKQEQKPQSQIYIENNKIEFTKGVLNEGCPPIELLEASISSIDINQANDMKIRLELVLQQFELDFLKIKDVSVGASITRFTFAMDASGRIGAVTKVQNEMAIQLGVSSIRISTSRAGLILEVPNEKQTPIPYREILEIYRLRKNDILEVPIGKLAAGDILTLKINELPHLLIAGGTGSGKSVCINTIIVSLLYTCMPNQLKFIFIDPKVVELKTYEKIPHLLMPVINDPLKADNALRWAVNEMEERYKKFASSGVRDINAYNKKFSAEAIPYIVIVIDELADLMVVAKSSKEVTIEDSICRLGQMARAAGMHLVIGTQRPSTEVLTGLIKTNIPGRIGFALPTQVDSRTIIDTAGAEKLLGKGDGLLLTTQLREPMRFQGAFLKDAEIEKVVAWWKINKTFEEETPPEETKIENESLDEQDQPNTKELTEVKSEVEIKLLVLLSDYVYGLDREYEDDGKEKEIELPWSREKLRETLSCGKASLQEALNKLESEGVIRSFGAGRGAKTYFNLSDSECFAILKEYSPETLEKYQ